MSAHRYPRSAYRDHRHPRKDRRHLFRDPQSAESMQLSSSHVALPTHKLTSLPILREEIVRDVNGSRKHAVTHKPL
ncbi:hypothetical protein P3T43_003787 [Paraburkholderia sp. GAS41]